MFSTILVKFAAILHKIKILKNPRWQPIWQTYCKTAIAIAAVLN